MKIIYDSKTGFVYTTVTISGDINPVVMDVDIPYGQSITRVIIEDGKEPRPEFYGSSSQDLIDELLNQIKELKENQNELNEKQNTTDLALAELTTNVIQ